MFLHDESLMGGGKLKKSNLGSKLTSVKGEAKRKK